MSARLGSLLLAGCVGAAVVSAQTVDEIRQRMGIGSGATGAAARGADTPLVETTWEKITDKKLFKMGELALGKDPNAWRHAETPHFVIHYRKAIDAKKVARQAEFYYQQIKSDLQATEDRFDRKNHLFQFEKPEDWQAFVKDAEVPEWAAGFASRSELFFLSRQHDSFAAGTLAHEITHCIFHRFVPHRIPMWLNEGFAEFESGNAYAKFKGIGGGARANARHGPAKFPIQRLLAATEYPDDRSDVSEFYATSARLVRFLITKLDRKRFLPLVNKIVEGAKFEDAVLAVYPDKFKTFADFERAYERAD